MVCQKLDEFFRALLDIDGFSAVDRSLNGLQVDNNGADIEKIAFAVDANMETFERAAEASAGMLFVHHGLFWGAPLQVAGSHRRRLKFLLDRNLALYAAHLPLDQHPQWGNSAILAAMLGIVEPEPFGLYKGRKVGYKGALTPPLTIHEAAERMVHPPPGVYPFGPALNKTCAVIAGGAANEARQAIAEGIDLYVTGEMSHQVYYECIENGLNMIAGGHYATEVWGVRGIMERCAETLPLSVAFIDAPTGL
jgi:dinuclear metal center YbgI/SA1388 family protein